MNCTNVVTEVDQAHENSQPDTPGLVPTRTPAKLPLRQEKDSARSSFCGV